MNALSTTDSCEHITTVTCLKGAGIVLPEDSERVCAYALAGSLASKKIAALPREIDTSNRVSTSSSECFRAS
jgi:hypothetical protein